MDSIQSKSAALKTEINVLTQFMAKQIEQFEFSNILTLHHQRSELISELIVLHNAVLDKEELAAYLKNIQLLDNKMLDSIYTENNRVKTALTHINDLRTYTAV